MHIYKFKYRAINVNGSGEFSSTGFIPAVYKPSQPEKPKMIQVKNTDITIQIFSSSENGGFNLIRCDIFQADYLLENWTKISRYNGISSTITLSTATDSLITRNIYK